MKCLISSYYSDSEVDAPNFSYPIIPTSATRFTPQTITEFKTDRITGRRDYLIVFVRSGCVHYTSDGEEHIAQTGDIILYRPYEPQHYRYYLKDLPDVYSLHFSGSMVEEILDEYSIKTGCNLNTKIEEAARLYDEIIAELDQKDEHCMNLVRILTEKLLILISRENTPKNGRSKSLSAETEALVEYFKNNLSSNISIAEIADRTNMSVSGLNKLFKTRLGMSPKQYLIYLRIKRAKAMLTVSEISITDIAQTVGYKDALYFSRLFNSEVGMSPSDYRKQHSWKSYYRADKKKKDE